MMVYRPEYVIGLDLGQAADPSALCVVECNVSMAGDDVYAVRHLERWPLGTSYCAIAKDVAALAYRPELNLPRIACDQTGVGRPVVEMIVRALEDVDDPDPIPVRPILITTGHAVSHAGDGTYHVAKVQLVSVLQALLSSGRLKVAPGLQLASTLVAELKAFKVKFTVAGNETFAAWREKDHDDLVLAVALALWLADCTPRPSNEFPGACGGRSWR
jgi:hypothetical protein